MAKQILVLGPIPEHPQALPSYAAAADSQGGICVRQVLPAHAELTAAAPYAFRYISPTRPVVVFQGLDSTECDEFIFAIRYWAFLEGRCHDDAWMADLAFSRFIGGAVRWATTLPDETVKSWKLLQKALLAKCALRNQPTQNADGAAAIDESNDSDESFDLFD